MKANPTCIKCGVELTEENWYPSSQTHHLYICKKCGRVRDRVWRKTNPEKQKVLDTKAQRKKGHRPFDQNKDCSSYLGVHIAERVLSHVFKNVKRMPTNNPGYDVICNMDKRIDIKSACLTNEYPRWLFTIKRNTIADFFLCLAFDNREDLTPLHVWLIPGSKLNHLIGTSISPPTIHKWDKYKLDITKISKCCDTIRGI